MGHGHDIPEVPDYRIYKVEDVPKLMETKMKLASQGLRDPWLRNEVWKYHLGHGDSPVKTILSTLARGFKYGVVIAIAATAVSKTFARKVEHH